MRNGPKGAVTITRLWQPNFEYRIEALVSRTPIGNGHLSIADLP